MVDRLLDDGFEKLTVLDISHAALQRSRDRLGERAELVEWITTDVTEIERRDAFDIWHDRAVFHFLTTLPARREYVARLKDALSPRGSVVLATFGPQGPTQCSGLPVCRYDVDDLRGELGESFRLDHNETVDHVTPGGKIQQFLYTSFRRS